MLSAARDGVLITVRVAPRAARSGIAGTRDDALLVRLNAAPVDGAANAELIDVIADAMGYPGEPSPSPQARSRDASSSA